MPLPVSPRVSRVDFPPISAVRQRLAARHPDGKPLIDMCQAVPDYPPAEILRDYLSEIVRHDATSRYTPDEGLPGVRQSVSRWYGRRYACRPPDEQCICLTAGASQAFWLAMSVLCGEGDEVIVPLPAYFDHPMGLQALGIVPRFIPYSEMQPEVVPRESILSRCSKRTRAILLVSPSNPSGAVLSPEQIGQYFELARELNVALVVDETYNAFLPGDSSPHQLFNRADWHENFIHIASFGKTFALTGYRAGALLASPELIYQALKVQDSMVVCQPHVTQLALEFACNHLDDWVKQRNHEMQERQQRFLLAFKHDENPYQLISSGGFFAWVRHPFADISATQVVNLLIDKAHLACLPGEAFGPGLSDYLRLAIGNLSGSAIDSAVSSLRTARLDL